MVSDPSASRPQPPPMVAQVGPPVEGQPPDITEVAIAILFQGDRYLMQLRDDIPTIVYPGQWTFFGGHLEPGESPEVGIWRELAEEIQYRPPWLKLFERRITDTVARTVFYGPLTVPVQALTLCEGWDLGLWTVADIQQGDRYSPQAQQHRPIGAPHQAILLDFIAQRPTLVPPPSKASS